jgi:hypothetical protein
MKDELIEQMELEARLCLVCQDRLRTVACPRCGEPTICNWCHAKGTPASCDYCPRPPGMNGGDGT